MTVTADSRSTIHVDHAAVHPSSGYERHDERRSDDEISHACAPGHRLENEQTEPGRDEPSTEESFPWRSDLLQRGMWVTGDQLAPPRRARSVRVLRRQDDGHGRAVHDEGGRRRVRHHRVRKPRGGSRDRLAAPRRSDGHDRGQAALGQLRLPPRARSTTPRRAGTTRAELLGDVGDCAKCRPPARARIHWSAAGQPTRSQRPSAPLSSRSPLGERGRSRRPAPRDVTRPPAASLAPGRRVDVGPRLGGLSGSAAARVRREVSARQRAPSRRDHSTASRGRPAVGPASEGSRRRVDHPAALPRHRRVRIPSPVARHGPLSPGTSDVPCRRRPRHASRCGRRTRCAYPCPCRSSGGSGRLVARASTERHRRARAQRARSRAPRRRSDRTATSSPRGTGRGALRAVLLHDPDARIRRDEQPPRRGSEKSAGCARSIPTVSRISSRTARPGGLSTAASSAAATTATQTGRSIRWRTLDRLALGERSRETTFHVRARASVSPGISIRSSSRFTARPPAHRGRAVGAS